MYLVEKAVLVSGRLQNAVVRAPAVTVGRINSSPSRFAAVADSLISLFTVNCIIVYFNRCHCYLLNCIIRSCLLYPIIPGFPSSIFRCICLWSCLASTPASKCSVVLCLNTRCALPRQSFLILPVLYFLK